MRSTFPKTGTLCHAPKTTSLDAAVFKRNVLLEYRFYKIFTPLDFYIFHFLRLLAINFFEIFNNDRPLGSTENQLDLNIIAIIITGHRDAFTVGFQNLESVMLQILEQILNASIPIIHNSTK